MKSETKTPDSVEDVYVEDFIYDADPDEVLQIPDENTMYVEEDVSNLPSWKVAKLQISRMRYSDLPKPRVEQLCGYDAFSSRNLQHKELSHSIYNSPTELPSDDPYENYLISNDK